MSSNFAHKRNYALPPAPQGYEARMPRHAEATDLMSVGLDANGRSALLTPEAARAWLSMREEAEKERVDLLLISSFRSIARQNEILTAKLAKGLSLNEILEVNAYPGFSEHHTGRAIDLGSPDCPALTVDFAGTREFAWLRANAARFRFALSYPPGNPFGIAYEPWHWCLTDP